MFWKILLLIIAGLILLFSVWQVLIELQQRKRGLRTRFYAFVVIALASLGGIYQIVQLLQPSEIKSVVKGQEEIKQMISELSQRMVEPTYYRDGIPQSTNLNLRTLFRQGEEHLSKNEFDKAIKSFRAGLALQGIKPSESAALLVYIANIQYIQNKWDEAIGSYTEALDLAREGKDEWGHSTCLANLGVVFRLKGYLDKAIQFTDSSLKMKKKLDDTLGMAHAYNNLGVIYQDSGEYDIAIEYYNKSLKIKEQLDDVYEVLGTYCNLGTAYMLKGESDKAKEYFNRILKKLEVLDVEHENVVNKKRMSQIYNNLGGAYLAIGELDKALDCFKRSLKIKKEIGDEYGIAYVKGNIGHLYKIQGKKNEARKFLMESLKAFEQYGDNRNAAIAWKQLEDL
jgi:tetratricopeptide (TPR) repeat protein